MVKHLTLRPTIDICQLIKHWAHALLVQIRYQECTLRSLTTWSNAPCIEAAWQRRKGDNDTLVTTWRRGGLSLSFSVTTVHRIAPHQRGKQLVHDNYIFLGGAPTESTLTTTSSGFNQQQQEAANGKDLVAVVCRELYDRIMIMSLHDHTQCIRSLARTTETGYSDALCVISGYRSMYRTWRQDVVLNVGVFYTLDSWGTRYKSLHSGTVKVLAHSVVIDVTWFVRQIGILRMLSQLVLMLKP